MKMNKKLSEALKYILSIAAAVALLYFSFRGVNWKDFYVALKECSWIYVLLAFALGILCYWVRGVRWKMLLEPIDDSISIRSSFNAINICMITNLVLPRVGELIRCGYITKNSSRDSKGHRKATPDKVFGTVVIDRGWDIFFGFVTAILVFSLLWGKYGDFISENILTGLSERLSLWKIGLALLVLFAGFVFAVWKLHDRSRFLGKIWKIFKGVTEGLKTCLHMRRGWLFVVYTLVVWALYWMMSFAILLAVQKINPASVGGAMAEGVKAIQSLGLVDALFIMFAGSLSSLLPVPGGFGAYHSIVAGALLSVYGVPFEFGLLFATLSHETQTLASILAGGWSYADETLRK